MGQGEQSSGLNLGMLRFQVVCGLLSAKIGGDRVEIALGCIVGLGDLFREWTVRSNSGDTALRAIDRQAICTEAYRAGPVGPEGPGLSEMGSNSAAG